MNRAMLMLAALDGGQWRSRNDLFDHATTFYLTNNAASELRALGYDVEQRRYLGNYEYRLQLCSGEPSVASPQVQVSPRHQDAVGVPLSASSEQLSLAAAV